MRGAARPAVSEEAGRVGRRREGSASLLRGEGWRGQGRREAVVGTAPHFPLGWQGAPSPPGLVACPRQGRLQSLAVGQRVGEDRVTLCGRGALCAELDFKGGLCHPPPFRSSF